MQNAISSFYGLFICSAGNGKFGIGFNTDLTPYYPSCFPLDNIISVGAIDKNGNRTSFSNYGAQTVDLFAPGEEIISTHPTFICMGGSSVYTLPSCTPSTPGHIESGYHVGSGTSPATAFTSGAAALVKSFFPNISPYNLKQMILSNVEKDIPDLLNKCVSGGRLNVANIFNSFSNKFGGGNGTETDPFIIQTAQHLKNLDMPYYMTENKFFKLANDITAYSGSYWEPIDNFYGILDGDGKKIQMLYLNNYNNPNCYYGLFATNSGTIKDLTIEGYIYIWPNGNGDVVFSGLFAGYNAGIIENSISFNSVFSSDMVYCSTGNAQTGAIAGINFGTVSGCVNNGSFNTTGISGGIAGNNWGTVEDCINNGTIDCWGTAWMIDNTYYKAAIGGVVGLINIGTVKNCENTGQIVFTEPYCSYTFVQPHASQIIGRGYTYYGPTFSGNICSGTVDPGNLHYENGFNQAEYVSLYGEIGWFQ